MYFTFVVTVAGIILGMGPVNEGKGYYVRPPLICRALTQNYPCLSHIQPPVRFLARTAEWSAVGILRRCCSRVHIRLQVPYVRLDTAVHLFCSNNSQDSTGTPCDARAGVVRALHGNLQFFSYPTAPVRGPCGTRKGVVRYTYAHVRELTQPEFAKIPHGCRM